MNSDKLFIIKIGIFTLILLSIKYAISYLLNFNEDIFFKILKLSEMDFYEYAYMVESLSNFNFKFDWSIKMPAEKFQGFPIFSLIWHSIFFKFFGYYSFLFLEYFFYIVLLLFLFKFIKFTQEDNITVFFSVILLLLLLETILFFINFYDLYFLNKLKIPLYDFISHRFPRPLLTSTYFFSSLYFINKILNFNSKVKTINFFFLGLSFFFLINSFFYLFIPCFLAFLLCFVLKFKKKIFVNIKENIFGLIILFAIITFGILTTFIHTVVSEPSHFIRMGGFNVSLEDKLNIAKIFFKKIFQIEILILISISLIIKLNYKRLKINKINFITLDFLFFFFVCSFLSPYFFLLVSNKAIALNHFWTIVKFSGFFFIFLAIINYFSKTFLKNRLNFFSYFIIIAIFILNFLNFFSKEVEYDKNTIKDKEELKSFLIINNFTNSEYELFTDNYQIGHLWLMLNNKYIIQNNGFIVSTTDQQIENSVFNNFKIFKISDEIFYEMLNEQKSGRNSFATIFKYKYSVNSIRHYKPLKKEYSEEDINYINKTPPLIQWRTIIPNSEKKRFLKNYQNYSINNYLLPDLIIITNPSINNEILLSKYEVIFSNNTYTVFKKN